MSTQVPPEEEEEDKKKKKKTNKTSTSVGTDFYPHMLIQRPHAAFMARALTEI